MADRVWDGDSVALLCAAADAVVLEDAAASVRAVHPPQLRGALCVRGFVQRAVDAQLEQADVRAGGFRWPHGDLVNPAHEDVDLVFFFPVQAVKGLN